MNAAVSYRTAEYSDQTRESRSKNRTSRLLIHLAGQVERRQPEVFDEGRVQPLEKGRLSRNCCLNRSIDGSFVPCAAGTTM